MLLQLLALMGVRKLMDFVFTQTELYWLDHMLPGEERIEKEDAQVINRLLMSTSLLLFSYLLIVYVGAMTLRTAVLVLVVLLLLRDSLLVRQCLVSNTNSITINSSFCIKYS